MDMHHAPVYVYEAFRQINAASIESDPDPSRLERIELAVLYENKPAFVELINNSPSQFLEEELDLIRIYLFMWDSEKCFAAVLDGQTQITEIPRLAKSWLSEVDKYPLHYAAGHSAPKIAALLLQRGLSADFRCDFDEMAPGTLNNALPLHVVMACLRRDLTMLNKNKELPAIMLVYKLCQLPGRGALELIRLFALNTSEIKREFFNYLKEGRMIEVGALLLVAKSHILSPSTTRKVQGEFRSVSEMRDFVLNTKNNKLVEMKEMLVLLEILDKIGDELATILRLDITETCEEDYCTRLAESLLEDAGFDVKPFDYKHPCSRGEVLSYFFRRANGECRKPVCTSDMLPSWGGLREKSASTSRPTYPFLAEALPYVNSVPVSQLTPGSASPSLLENMAPLYNLMNKSAPIFRTIKRMFRRGSLLR